MQLARYKKISFFDFNMYAKFYIQKFFIISSELDLGHSKIYPRSI